MGLAGSPLAFFNFAALVQFVLAFLIGIPFLLAGMLIPGMLLLLAGVAFLLSKITGSAWGAVVGAAAMAVGVLLVTLTEEGSLGALLLLSATGVLYAILALSPPESAPRRCLRSRGRTT